MRFAVLPTSNYMPFAPAICMDMAMYFEVGDLGYPPHSSPYISDIYSKMHIAVLPISNCMPFAPAICMQMAMYFEVWALSQPPFMIEQYHYCMKSTANCNPQSASGSGESKIVNCTLVNGLWAILLIHLPI